MKASVATFSTSPDTLSPKLPPALELVVDEPSTQFASPDRLDFAFLPNPRSLGQDRTYVGDDESA
jgi:hypothetical protein